MIGFLHEELNNKNCEGFLVAQVSCLVVCVKYLEKIVFYNKTSELSVKSEENYVSFLFRLIWQ